MKMAFKKRVFLTVLPVWLLLVGVLAVSAQAGTPINVGDNKTGEITQAGSTISYALTVTAPQAVLVQAFEITAGFAPSFQVVDPSGVIIQSAVNTNAQTAVQATALLSNAGTYRIDVQSTSGQVGQFFLSIQPGPALQPPQPLTPGQSLPGSVSAAAPLQAYSFAASPTDVLLLSVLSDQPASGPTVTIKDADSGETLALSSARLGGVRYRIPTGAANYLVEVIHSGTTPSDTYAVCFESENVPSTCAPGTEVSIVPTTTLPTATLPAEAPTDVPLPTLPSTGTCVVASASGGRINVRSGPGTDFPVSGQLIGLSTAPVMGALPDHSWFEINVNGLIGWASATVIRFGGDCSTITTIVPTPSTSNATATPTTELTATATTTPTETATSAPTETPNGTPHIHPFPSIVAIGTLTNIQPINPKLDYQASANYGEANLSNGFSPDPYSVGMTTGGNVDVSYLGSSCSGFATSHPDLRINFGGGGASLLRIYFVGANGDAAMVINDPYGNFYCVDDSFGTVNPTIDFNNPAGGSYDVWIASYAANTTISGTLYLTENSGNHP